MGGIMLQSGTALEGIVGSEKGIAAGEQHWPLVYRAWKSSGELQVNPNGVFSLCAGCRAVWTAQHGFWIRVKVEGMEVLSLERFKETEGVLQTAAIIKANELPDPGEQPSPDSTKCPHCHVWREVRSWTQDTTKNIHICPKCGTGDVVESQEEA
jgi:hypothetical protein